MRIHSVEKCFPALKSTFADLFLSEIYPISDREENDVSAIGISDQAIYFVHRVRSF